MFAKFLSAIAKVRKVIFIVIQFLEVAIGVLEAAKANGYQFPGKLATA